jgi:hypothetical protein
MATTALSFHAISRIVVISHLASFFCNWKEVNIVEEDALKKTLGFSLSVWEQNG